MQKEKLENLIKNNMFNYMSLVKKIKESKVFEYG